MKDTHLFYVVCVVAVLVVGALGIGYATDILPLYKQSYTTSSIPNATVEPTVDTSTTSTSELEKKKDCSCCAERAAKIRARLEKIREKKAARQQTAKMPSK